MAKQEAIGRAVTSMIDALKTDGPDILKEKTPSNEERLQAPGGKPPPDPKLAPRIIKAARSISSSTTATPSD